MLLRDIAHSRAGDQGDISTISVIVNKPDDYPLPEHWLTAERVRQHFTGIVHGDVYAMPCHNCTLSILSCNRRWAAA